MSKNLEYSAMLLEQATYNNYYKNAQKAKEIVNTHNALK